MDLQSVDSVSLQGEMIQPPRRFSAGSEGTSLVNQVRCFSDEGKRRICINIETNVLSIEKYFFIYYIVTKRCVVFKSPLCFLFVQQSFMFLFQPQVEQDSLPSKQTLQGQDKRGRGSHSGTMRSNWELGGEGGGKEVRACKHLRMLLLRRKNMSVSIFMVKHFEHLVKCENFRL